MVAFIRCLTEEKYLVLFVTYQRFFFRPDLIDYDALHPEEHVSNLNNAFLTASRELDIPRILDAEGMSKLCLFTNFLSSDQFSFEKAELRNQKTLM